ncbi:hypothetical protein EDC01DRAFT_668681 [Geopyxis carbonaria]|nr:hypothetical protein EDC01DRAFT_668681 [Geopyxis carbonaria]
METLPPDALTITLKVFFASGFLWITATTFIKLSILLLYIGIFQTRPFLWAAWGVVSLSVMFWVACILTGFLMCRPLAFNWDKSIEDAHCGNTYSQEVGSAAINMILDFMIVILPLPVLWSLQVPVKKKIMLSGVLSLGLCICGMNITRVVMIATSDTVDYTYSLTNAGIFKGLEVYLGIVTSCLPTFGPLLVREKVMSRSHTFKNSNFTGPSKASTHNRSLFETVGGDDIPLRKVTAQGGRDPYAVSMHGEGISVKTEVQVFGSPAGRARKGLML